MKKLFFLLILLLDLLVVQAQEIVVADSSLCQESFYKKSYSNVYRPKEADLFIRKHVNEIKPGEHWLGKPIDKWAFWLVDRIVSEKVRETFLNLPDKRMHYDDCSLLVYYDSTGQILAAEYVMDSLMRTKITDDQLNSTYRNLMKERVRNPDYTSDVEKKDLISRNRLMSRSNEIFYVSIPLVKITKVVERMKTDEKELWRYIQSRIEDLLKKEIEADL